jgi:hypothetical protein
MEYQETSIGVKVSLCSDIPAQDQLYTSILAAGPLDSVWFRDHSVSLTE